jgi:intracellular septation protein
MKLLIDFFPMVLFFISYKIFDIYTATAVAMIASFIQIVYYRFKHQRFEKMHLISFVIIFIFGSATLFFHNPWFIKWKPTGIYWLTSLIFILSTFFAGKKPLIQRMMEHNVHLPKKIWYRLNNAWIIFFALMGALNLYVAYFYSTNTWVNFKLFGGIGLTLIFVCLQAVYLTKHVLEKDPGRDPTTF